MSKPDAVGRLIQWAIELSEFDIEYRPRQAIKAQALADFIAEFTRQVRRTITRKGNQKRNGKSTSMDRPSRGQEELELSSRHPKDRLLKHAVRLQYPTTNNEAEYEALLIGLYSQGVGSNHTKGSKRLTTGSGQVNSEYEAKEDRMTKYLDLVRSIMTGFNEVSSSKSLESKT
jgi:hypothetical protein